MYFQYTHKKTDSESETTPLDLNKITQQVEEPGISFCWYGVSVFDPNTVFFLSFESQARERILHFGEIK